MSFWQRRALFLVVVGLVASCGKGKTTGGEHPGGDTATAAHAISHDADTFTATPTRCS